MRHYVHARARALSLGALLLLVACQQVEGPFTTRQASKPYEATTAAALPVTDAKGEPYRPSNQPHEASPAGNAAVPRTARMVIRNASLELRADDPRAALRSATQIAEAAQGFVVSSTVSGSDESTSSSTTTLRVPAERFEPVLQQLRALGTPLHESVSGQDVTAEYIDLDAQLRAQRKLEENFLGILSKAQTVEETLKVEGELSRVRTEIERLEGRTRYLSDQAALSTITLVATAPYQAYAPQAESAFSRIGRAFREAGDLTVETLVGLIVLLGVLVPVTAVLLPLVLWIRRRRATLRAHLSK